MASLSLCMICKDEEKTLDNCLKHAKKFVDEIIIVDTGSTDKTKEIAKTYTKKIFDFKWCDDFSKAKNYALSKATKEWILVLDADEVIYYENFKKIMSILENSKKIGLIYLNRLEYEIDYSNYETNVNYLLLKGFSNIKIERKPRLFRNNDLIKYESCIHEQLKYPNYFVLNKLISNIFFFHFKDINKNLFKTKKYHNLQIKSILKDKNNSNSIYNMLIFYLIQNQYNLFNKLLNKLDYIQFYHLGMFKELSFRCAILGLDKESKKIDQLIRISRKKFSKSYFLNYCEISKDFKEFTQFKTKI